MTERKPNAMWCNETDQGGCACVTESVKISPVLSTTKSVTMLTSRFKTSVTVLHSSTMGGGNVAIT